MRRRIVLVNTPQLPCPDSHYLHTKKFLNGFVGHGLEHTEITNSVDLESLTNNDIVYVSNHGLEHNSSSELCSISQSGAFPIFWNGHRQLKQIRELFGQKYILTGEHFLCEPGPSHREAWDIQLGDQNFVPLTFASSLQVNEIGTLPRSDVLDAHFVGTFYKMHWNALIRASVRRVSIVYSPPFIPESIRREIYLSSRVALGWHSNANIRNGVVVERVFEGLAFGNVVISDNPYAPVITDGIVQFVPNPIQAIRVIKRFKRNPGLVEEIRQRGFEWARTRGTYFHVAKSFLDAVAERHHG